MSFAYKKLSASDIKSVPYVANKQYNIPSSSYADLGIKTYVGEYIPITTERPFDPENDNLTPDGEYRRLVYESIKHLYYQNYVTASSTQQGQDIPVLVNPDNSNYFFHSSSYDNYLQNTMASGSYPNSRYFPYYPTVEFDYNEPTASLYGTAQYFLDVASKVRVLSFPKDIYGEGLKPNSFNITGDNFNIVDDGNGNLLDVFTDLTSSIPVGNIFYNHGLAVITNKEYLCFLESAPIARNNFPVIENIQEVKIIQILEDDFDDCSTVATGSVSTFPHPDFPFPDYSVSQSGDIIITPNANSVVPGEYRLYYSVKNLFDFESNTGSIVLRVDADPLTLTTQSLTQSCYEGNLSASLTFSIDYGVPPYSWSIDNTNYTPINGLFQPIVSASLTPTRSLVLSIKDRYNAITSQTINTSFLPIDGKLWQNDVSFCGTNDGYIIASASGDLPITASLSASFDNAVELPNTMSGLEVGTYTVYFKDVNNCTTTSQIEVTKTIPVTASYQVTNIDCYGSNTGKIILDELDENDEFQDYFLTGGALPLTWSWSGPNSFLTDSINIENVPSGSYILNIFDGDGCVYGFTYDIFSQDIISYDLDISYDDPYSSSLLINNFNGGVSPYYVTASTATTEYKIVLFSGDSIISLTEETLNSASITLSVTDSFGCVTQSENIQVYSRTWEVSESFCEDGTGSVAQRNLNFYTNEPTGSEWVKVLLHSGSETPIQLDTSGSATGSYSWNSNDTLYIDIYTGSNDAFYLRREFSGSSDTPGVPANITGSEITSSVIISGSGRMDNFEQNLDVSINFGSGYNLASLHLTASKANTEELTTDINFKFDKQIALSVIRDNFTGSVSNLITTGSFGSGSNFIARNDEFTDIIYGNTGSFIGPNKLLFRPTYAFGNIINTISGSNVEYTSGSIWSGSVSASIFGGENAQYFTQRTDKAWLLTADVDHISFLESYSYTDPNVYEALDNLTPYSHREYTIYAGYQNQPTKESLLSIMIIHEDEEASLATTSGMGGGEIASRKLENLNDVNRVYYLFMSPSGSITQNDFDNRAVAVGKYFIDNVIYG